MALTFGQLLAGAGRVASGMREEQSKQIQLQEQQMRLAELRRLQAEQELERQALQQKQGGYITAPLFTAGLPMDPVQVQAQQQAQQQAAQQATQPQQATQTLDSTPVAPDGRLPDGTYLSMTERWERATPEERAQIAREQGLESVSPESYFIGAGGLLRGLNFLRSGRGFAANARANINALGTTPSSNQARAALAESAEKVLQGAPSAAPAITRLGAAGSLEAAAGEPPPAGEQNPATAVAEEGPPQTGVTEQTQRIFANTDFYLGNPNAITPDMQNVANQRQELVRMAELYRRNGMVNKYQEAVTRIKEADDSLIQLQGMRGVSELRTFNNPLRLEQALSYVSGQTIRLRPRTDGNYDFLVADPDGNFVVAQAGVSRDELANRAIFTFDQNAAAQAAQRNAELQQLAQEEAIKAGVAMRQAAFEAGLERPELATLADGQTDILIGGTGRAPSFSVVTPPVPAGREGGFFGIGGTPTPATYYGLRSFEGFENNLSDQQIRNIIDTPEFRSYWSNRQGK